MHGYEDSFGKLIADNTRDVIDIGSHLLQGGGGQNSYRYDAGGDQVQKRKIPQKDYLVILAKSGSTGDITYDCVSEQDW
jgi:hypothetical protein